MESDDIIVYTTKACPQCKVVKSYLNARNIDFTEIDVNSPELIQEVVNVSGLRTVPLVVTKKGIMVGFDTSRLKEII